jgi:hypothetical protein
MREHWRGFAGYWLASTAIHRVSDPFDPWDDAHPEVPRMRMPWLGVGLGVLLWAVIVLGVSVVWWLAS